MPRHRRYGRAVTSLARKDRNRSRVEPNPRFDATRAGRDSTLAHGRARQALKDRHPKAFEEFLAAERNKPMDPDNPTAATWQARTRGRALRAMADHPDYKDEFSELVEREKAKLRTRAAQQ